MKIWIALQHSSGLLAAVGLFFAVTAFTSDTGSQTVYIGLMVAALGLVGFVVGRYLAKRHGP